MAVYTVLCAVVVADVMPCRQVTYSVRGESGLHWFGAQNRILQSPGTRHAYVAGMIGSRRTGRFRWLIGGGKGT